MQRSAEWAEGHGPTLPGRLDALSDARSEFQRRQGQAAPIRIITTGWISSTRWGSEEHAHRHRQFIDSLLALVNGKCVVLRVPYPLGFFAKGMDGRIDDPKAGWKGKGVWTTWGTRTPFHSETGKGTTSKVVHFQIRPNPLAD